MKKTTLVFWLIILFIYSTFGQTPSPEPFQELIGLENQIAPNFIKKGMDGNEYNLANLKGNIVVVNLWATFCSPCIVEMPPLNELVEKFKGKKVIFLAPTPQKADKVTPFFQKHIFKYQVIPIAFDVIAQYAPKKKGEEDKPGSFMMLLPTHLIIDQKGVVRKHIWGFKKDTTNILAAEIDKLLEITDKN